jgi:hypothetical protein
VNDTDGLAAETRRLLDAATDGPWVAHSDPEMNVVWRLIEGPTPDRELIARTFAEHDGADGALIAAAPRLLANWLARSEQTEAVEDDLGRIANENAALAGRLMAERDRLADENRALREAIRAHEDLHRPDGPDGPDGPIEMDGWPCCDDDRHLWAAADRATPTGTATKETKNERPQRSRFRPYRRPS